MWSWLHDSVHLWKLVKLHAKKKQNPANFAVSKFFKNCKHDFMVWICLQHRNSMFQMGVLPQPGSGEERTVWDGPRAAGRPGVGSGAGPHLKCQGGDRTLASGCCLLGFDSLRPSPDPSLQFLAANVPGGQCGQPCLPRPWPERTCDLDGPVRSLPWHFLCRRWGGRRSLFSMDLSCQDVTKAVRGHILCHLEEPRRKWPQVLRWGRPWLRPAGPAPSCSP